jgi:hypothetical protein
MLLNFLGGNPQFAGILRIRDWNIGDFNRLPSINE